MPKYSLETSISKNINSYEVYLRYAMEHFIKALATIKKSIASSVMEDMKRNNPDLATTTMEQQVYKMVEEKISVLAQIDFKE